ncbi:hypothetical protein [Kitasatospora sp. NPDC051914]|uniref:hypothetical protein n=1 Tax=Kitasatospora sp. NPDC051914 TaxID=3154945 RepID=UPI0034461CB3
MGTSTTGQAISGTRPLPAARVRRSEPRGIRRRTLADVFAYADAEGVILCIDGMETKSAVRRRAALADGPSSGTQAEHHQDDPDQ